MTSYADIKKNRESECCPICESENIRLLYSTCDRHYGIKGTFNIFECNRCSIGFLNPMPTEDELTSLYPENTFYAYTDFTQKNDKIYNIKKALRKLLLLTIETKDPKFSKPGRILDLGCGSGEFLYRYKECGWETNGVEVNSDAANLGNSIANLGIHCGNLLQANFEDGYFDYVRSNHSFEHITNPKEVLKEVHRILKKDGKLFIGVPNVNSLNAKLFGKYWWYLGVPVHTFTYSDKTLSSLLRDNGFIIDSVKYNSDYSGILGSIQIFLNRKNGKLSTEGFVFENPFLRILSTYLSKALNLLKLGDAIEVICRKDSK
jgi:SAM-dependent methyltransferase